MSDTWFIRAYQAFSKFLADYLRAMQKNMQTLVKDNVSNFSFIKKTYLSRKSEEKLSDDAHYDY